MSRSNPTEGAKNPATRWFEFAAGADGGFVRYYDKEQEKQIALGDAKAGSKFVFTFLDELATVKGWHDPSESGIFANEVRDTRQDTLVVRAFKGGELASGLYGQIKDKVVAVGGHYVASVYIAYKEGDEMKLGNLRFKGASLGAWMDFKKECPTKKDPKTGKTVKAYMVDAIAIAGFKQEKKGGTTFRIPVFKLVPLSEESNQRAIDLDKDLQGYLNEYLKRPRAEAATPAGNGSAGNPHFDDLEDDKPWEDASAGGSTDSTDDIPF